MKKILNKIEYDFYIVPVPIGNPNDITLRAIDVLKNVDIIYCEDTRVTSKLLNLIGISNKKLYQYNDHSSKNDREKILYNINEGKKIALVSDAGTPLIADPGYKLINFLYENNIKITSLPGPSSVITALTLSGLPSDSFYFHGFLSNKQNQSKKELEKLIDLKTTSIFFESANRLLKTLENISNISNIIEVSVVKEISKLFEEVIKGKTLEIIDFLQNHNDKICGEFVVLINSRINENIIDANLIKEQTKKMITNCYTNSEIIEFLRLNYNISRNEAYKIILENKG